VNALTRLTVTIRERLARQGMGTRMAGLLVLVSLITLAVTALVDFVLWPMVLEGHFAALRLPGVEQHGRDRRTSADLLAVVLGFGCAVVVSIGLSLVIARRLNRSVERLSTAARQVADGRPDVRVAPVSLGPEAGELVSAFNEMATRLESTDRSRRRLLADLAHEIRTPVSVLDGYLEGMQDGVVVADDETVTMLRAQTNRLARLTADVLAVSHADEGALDLRPSEVDVRDLVESAVAAARKAYADRGVVLRARIKLGRTVIRADRLRLDQVLANLLANALRHSPPGTAVEVVAETVSHRRVRISVIDTGDGIEAEHLPWIFERFYRTDVARDRDSGGSGVGLTICRAIVTAHDGHLSVESDGAGTGATFAMTLPAR
jgi:two-component system sensor histidine kinase BaeS